jgi:hypothetical protein
MQHTGESLPLVEAKTGIIDFAFTRFGITSFADLGGVWGVEGGYTFHALAHPGITTAVMVDTHPTTHFRAKAREYPQLRVITGNFGDEAVVEAVGEVDAVFLFDVLLHQVSPDWDVVIEMYSNLARCLVIYNQQWIGGKETVRLLELGEEQYFSNVPHDPTQRPYSDLFAKLDEKHPDHDRPWRDVHHIWQWGITDRDLRGKVESLGYRMQFMMNCGRFGDLDSFENHAFVFHK